MNKADNIRSRKTQQRMEEVYLELLEADPDRPVNVKQLCSYANVNRSTFYTHYTDVFDLQKRIEERISAEVSAIFRDKGYGENRMTKERFSVLLEYIRQHHLFYRTWYKSGRMDEPSALGMVLNRPHMTEAERFKVLFFKAGTTAIVKDWVNRGCQESNDQILSVFAELYQW